MAFFRQAGRRVFSGTGVVIQTPFGLDTARPKSGPCGTGLPRRRDIHLVEVNASVLPEGRLEHRIVAQHLVQLVERVNVRCCQAWLLVQPQQAQAVRLGISLGGRAIALIQRLNQHALELLPLLRLGQLIELGLERLGLQTKFNGRAPGSTVDLGRGHPLASGDLGLGVLVDLLGYLRQGHATLTQLGLDLVEDVRQRLVGVSPTLGTSGVEQADVLAVPHHRRAFFIALDEVPHQIVQRRRLATLVGSHPVPFLDQVDHARHQGATASLGLFRGFALTGLHPVLGRGLKQVFKQHLPSNALHQIGNFKPLKRLVVLGTGEQSCYTFLFGYALAFRLPCIGGLPSLFRSEFSIAAALDLHAWRGCPSFRQSRLIALYLAGVGTGGYSWTGRGGVWRRCSRFLACLRRCLA